jgi:hypothetical protein
VNDKIPVCRSRSEKILMNSKIIQHLRLDSDCRASSVPQLPVVTYDATPVDSGPSETQIVNDIQTGETSPPDFNVSSELAKPLLILGLPPVGWLLTFKQLMQVNLHFQIFM